MKKRLYNFATTLTLLALMLATNKAYTSWWDDPQEGAQRRAEFWQGKEDDVRKGNRSCMRADDALEIMLAEGMKLVFAGSVGIKSRIWVELWIVPSEIQRPSRWMMFSRHNGPGLHLWNREAAVRLGIGRERIWYTE